MRKRAKYMLATLLMFCLTANVKAAECSYEKQVELNNIASTVKATYESVEIDSGEKYYDETFDENGNPNMKTYYIKGFNIKLLNLTENLYAEVSNSLGETRTIYYSDTDKGTISLGTKEAEQIITYSIKIHASTSECGGTDLRTIDLVVPRYNYYSETSFCQDNPEFEYCQEYTTDAEDVDLIKFDEEAKKYTENKENKENNNKKQKETFWNKIKSFFKEKGIIILSIIGSIGVITIAVIVIRKRRRLI